MSFCLDCECIQNYSEANLTNSSEDKIFRKKVKIKREFRSLTTTSVVASQDKICRSLTTTIVITSQDRNILLKFG